MRMRRKMVEWTAAIAIIVLSAGAAMGADATVGADLNSAYVWRGITLNDGVVLQPYVDVTTGGFGVNVWGNLDLDDYDGALDDGEFSEIDITLSYGWTWGAVDLSVGFIEYLFPSGTLDGTREIYVSAGCTPIETLEGLSAGIEIYYDIDEIKGFYSNLGVAYGFDPADNFSVEIGLTVGLVDEDFSEGNSGGIDGGFHEINISISGSYACTDALSISAFIAYTDSLDEDVLPEQDTDVYGGIGVSYAF